MKRKFTKKDIWRLYPVLILIGIFLFFSLKGRKETKVFFNSPLTNIVIKRNNWQIRTIDYYLDNGIRISSTNSNDIDLQLGDSIVKKEDSYTFRVYRKDSTGKYRFIKQYTLKP